MQARAMPQEEVLTRLQSTQTRPRRVPRLSQKNEAGEVPKKTVEEMASCLLLKLGKETKPTQVCKRPAANVEEEQPTKVAKMGDVNKKATKAASKDDTLNFPGIEKQPKLLQEHDHLHVCHKQQVAGASPRR